jgi:hypothetical protein
LPFDATGKLLIAEVDGFISQQDALFWTKDFLVGESAVDALDLMLMDFFLWGYNRYLVHSERVEFFPICPEGLQRLPLRCLWMCHAGQGVKWNFVSTSVEPSLNESET